MNRLGQTHRAGAFVLIAVGLLSFFEPLIATKPAVIGRAHWSLLDIVMELQRGGLHADPADLVVPSVVFGLVYVLLLFALMILLFFPNPRLLASVGAVGAIPSYLIFRFGDMDLEGIFYRQCCSLTTRVRHFELASVLLVVMIMLTLLSLTGSTAAPRDKPRILRRLKQLK